MSDQNKGKKEVDYGFIKPSLEQWIFAGGVVLIFIICMTPMFTRSTFIHLSVSQWVLGAVSFVFPIISIIRIIADSKK